MQKLTKRRIEIQNSYNDSIDELEALKNNVSQEIIDGGNSSKISSKLSDMQDDANLLKATLDVLDQQIETLSPEYESAKNEHEAKLNAKAQQITRKKLAKVLESFKDTQLELARIQLQANHNPIYCDIDAAMDSLGRAQELIESDPEIAELSTVPRARKIGGFIDEAQTVKTRGRAILDFAFQEVRR